MEDVVEVIKERIKAPYFGYSLLAFIFLNWRAFYFLVKTKGLPVDRLAAFDSATNNLNLMVWPFLLGAVAVVIRPWLGLLEDFFRIKPESLILELQFRSESKRIERQHKLDSDRRVVLASIEKDLIDRAKRDQEIDGIFDEKLKEQLRNKIVHVREGYESEEEHDIFNENKQALGVFEEIVRNNGKLSIQDYENGKMIVLGELIVGEEERYMYMKAMDAIRHFIRKNWLEESDVNSNSFDLTFSGWKVAEQLSLIG